MRGRLAHGVGIGIQGPTGEMRIAELRLEFKAYLDPGIGIVNQHIQTPTLFSIDLLKQAFHFTLLA